DEVVLTFDDGPVPRYTNSVLETLASECVKATFFMVGQMARAYPSMVRRVYDEGHTIANHTQNHPIRKMSAAQAAREIEEGFASLREAVGDPQAVSPFFRIPGLLRQKSVEQYLAAHGNMTWSADFVADDWTRINNSEVARRAISRIEARGPPRQNQPGDCCAARFQFGLRSRLNAVGTATRRRRPYGGGSVRPRVIRDGTLGAWFRAFSGRAGFHAHLNGYS